MDEEKSKSQQKREATALQKIGAELTALSVDKLALLPLTDSLRQAILTAKTLRSHGAIRRQQQYIGKLMRAAPHEDIINAFNELKAQHHTTNADFHQAEYWREQLLSGDGEALTAFIKTYQPADIQQLKHLIKKAKEEQQLTRHTGAGKQLFRYIRQCF